MYYKRGEGEIMGKHKARKNREDKKTEKYQK